MDGRFATICVSSLSDRRVIETPLLDWVAYLQVVLLRPRAKGRDYDSTGRSLTRGR